MAVNPDKNIVEQSLIARLIGKIKRIALDMGDSVSAETTRATAAEAAAKTEVVQGENCTIEKTTAADGHDVYTVNADGKPQVQADWNQADSSKVDYIKNKPNLGLKADKVQGATAGNLAALDANGNLTDSGSKSADFKTKQTPVSDPSASGAGLEFIDSVSQNANGEITPHKKSVQDGTTAQKGVVKLSNAIDSTSVTEAATPKAVKDAYDELNNKIVARAVFLSQAEWAVQSQLPGDPAKVYYVENGTGEDAYTVYVWKEFTSTYEEVDESSIDLDGYWHDGPTTTGSGNVVTDITLGNDGVPQVTKGLTALTQHQSVTDNDPTLAWSTRSKVGTIGGTDLHVTMPSNPASGKLDSTGDASNTTATFSTASTRTNIASDEKLSVLFGKIAKWFGDLGTAAFKTLVTAWSGTTSNDNIPSEKLVKDSLDLKQNSLGISASGDPGKFLNERGVFATPNYPSVPSVINNLTSNSTTDALSAAQGKKLNDLMKRSSLPVIDEQITYAYIGCLPRDGMATGAFQSLSLTISYTPSLTNSNSIFSLTANLFFKSNKMIADLSTLYPNTQTPKLYWRYVASPAKMEFYVELPSHTSTWADFDYEASALDFDYTNIGKIASLPADCTLITNTTDKRVGSTSTPVYVKPDGTMDACSTSSMSVGSATTATHLSSNGVCDTWSAGSYDSTKPYAIIAESTYVINRHNGEGSLLQFEMGNDVLVRLKMHFTTNDGSVQIANVVVINSTHTFGWIKDNIRISYFTYTSNNTPYVAIRAYVKFTSDWQCWRARQLDCQSGDLGYENWRQWTFNNKRGSDQTNYVGTLASYSFRTPYTSTAVGSNTTPIYVDSNGQVQACDPSLMSVLNASKASAANKLKDEYGSSFSVGYDAVPVNFFDGVPRACANKYAYTKIYKGSASTKFDFPLQTAFGVSGGFNLWIQPGDSNTFRWRIYTQITGGTQYNTNYWNASITGMLRVRGHVGGVGVDNAIDEIEEINTTVPVPEGAPRWVDLYAYSLNTQVKQILMGEMLLNVSQGGTGSLGASSPFMLRIKFTIVSEIGSTTSTANAIIEAYSYN